MEERRKRVKETFDEMDASELESVVEHLLQDDSALSVLESALVATGYIRFPTHVKKTIILEYDIDEYGLLGNLSVTVDGQEAERQPREGRGLTAAWDIAPRHDLGWGFCLELGEW